MPDMFRPYEGDRPYIFISYAHDDAKQVLPLIKAMVEAGYRVWWDEGIYAGASWRETLIVRTENCEVFMPFFSPAFNVSRVCFDETNDAYRKDRPIVPVYLKPMKEEDLRPFFRSLRSRQELRRYQYDSDAAFVADLDREPVFALCKIVPPVPVPMPVPVPPPTPAPTPIERAADALEAHLDALKRYWRGPCATAGQKAFLIQGRDLVEQLRQKTTVGAAQERLGRLRSNREHLRQAKGYPAIPRDLDQDIDQDLEELERLLSQIQTA